MRVLIVGGGIGGLTAAIALSQKGVEVEVYERAAALENLGAGVSLWANALKALYQLGMRDRLESMSCVAQEAAIRNASGATLSHSSARDFVSRFGLATTVFHRAELLEALYQTADGVPIHLGHECQQVEQDGGGVTIQFAHGARAAGDLLVGADGLRSVVRARLGIAGEPRYAGYTAWRGVAPFATAGLVGGETLGRGQRFGLAPLTHDRVYWFATDNAPEGQREPPSSVQGRLAGLFGGWHSPIPALIRATDPTRILRNDIYDREPSDTWGSGRVTLLGDAAHPMTPNLGQGACQAIEDALVLARCVSAGRDAAALRRYESERLPRTTALVKASRRVGQIGQLEAPALCWLRDSLLRLTPVSATYRNMAPIVGYEGHLAG